MADTQRQCENIVNNHAQASAVPCEAQCHTDAGENTEQQKKPANDLIMDMLKDGLLDAAIEVSRFANAGHLKTATERVTGATPVDNMRKCASLIDFINNEVFNNPRQSNVAEGFNQGLSNIWNVKEEAATNISEGVTQGMKNSAEGIKKLPGNMAEEIAKKLGW